MKRYTKATIRQKSAITAILLLYRISLLTDMITTTIQQIAFFKSL